MSTALIYCRVSTPSQAEDGLGLEAQLDTCRSIAAQYALDVPEDYIIVEQGSGEFIERDGLDRMRSLVRHKVVDALICYRTDRLACDEVWQAVILREARDACIAVYTSKGIVDTTHKGSLINFVTGWSDALKKEKTRQRTMDGKRTAALNGVLPIGTGKGLYGYNYKARDRAHKQPQSRSVNQAEAAIVRRIFGIALEGLGTNTIAVALNQEGLRGKTGLPWHPWTIKNLLKNRSYIGQTSYGKEATRLLAHNKRERKTRAEADVIYIEGFTPAIIDTTTFEGVPEHLRRPDGLAMLMNRTCSPGCSGAPSDAPVWSARRCGGAGGTTHAVALELRPRGPGYAGPSVAAGINRRKGVDSRLQGR